MDDPVIAKLHEKWLEPPDEEPRPRNPFLEPLPGEEGDIDE